MRDFTHHIKPHSAVLLSLAVGSCVVIPYAEDGDGNRHTDKHQNKLYFAIYTHAARNGRRITISRDVMGFNVYRWL